MIYFQNSFYILLDKFVHVFEPNVSVLIMKIASHRNHDGIGRISIFLFLAVIEEISYL